MFDSKDLGRIRWALEQFLNNNNWEKNAEHEWRYLLARVYQAEYEVKA